MKTIKVLNAWEVKKSGNYLEVMGENGEDSCVVNIYYNLDTRDWSIVDLPHLRVTDWFDRTKLNTNKYIRLDNIG